MLKEVVVTLLAVGVILEFVEVKRESWRISLRKDITANLAGTVFGIIAVLIWLFG